MNKPLPSESAACRGLVAVLFALLVCGPGLCWPEIVHGQEGPTPSNRFIDLIRTPRDIPTPSLAKPVVIAVVDDGVRIGRQDLHAFIWRNQGERPNNGIDDDGNGFVDDLHGWNVADWNNRVSPPPKRAGEFFHGTHLTGIITRLARHAFGSRAPEVIRIMPVKALADQAEQMHIRKGYQGIEYAVSNGADIILCAWNVGHISADESTILQKARDQGVLLVSSVGNFPEEKEQYPAAHQTVLAVAAVDQEGKKAKFSNYGMFVDISAPGERIESADAASEDGFNIREGTSQAAAMVAAAAAMVKAQHPAYTPDMITACLKNGADALDVINPDYPAKMGAGLLNIRAAMACGLFAGKNPGKNHYYNPQGSIRGSRSENAVTISELRPYGQFTGFWFMPVSLRGNPGNARIWFSSEGDETTNQSGPFRLAEFTQPVFIPGTKTFVHIESAKGGEEYEFLMEYQAESINFKTLYCRDTVKQVNEGTLEDGSGEQPYAAGSDCKWFITAPHGKVINFSFSEFDTEANTDLLYFFDGPGTNARIMAVFSGQDLPPDFTTWNNQVLLWFVTNDRTQKKGWKATYSFVDKVPATVQEKSSMLSGQGRALLGEGASLGNESK